MNATKGEAVRIGKLTRMVAVSLVLMAASVTSLGCGACGGACAAPAKKQVEHPKEATAPALVLCGKCGQLKGSGECCAKDAVKCKGCGLAKGSPGCCKVTKGKDATLCAKCGEIKGSKICCAKDAVKSKECGLAKGSPGCCKI